MSSSGNKRSLRELYSDDEEYITYTDGITGDHIGTYDSLPIKRKKPTKRAIISKNISLGSLLQETRKMLEDERTQNKILSRHTAKLMEKNTFYENEIISLRGEIFKRRVAENETDIVIGECEHLHAMWKAEKKKVKELRKLLVVASDLL